MNKMKLLCSLIILIALPVLAEDPSINGSWKLSLNVNGNTYPMSCTFKQEGDKLTGSCKGAEAANEVKGEVQGQKLKWQHQVPYNGEMLTLTYSGSLASAAELKGTVDVQPQGISGDFTGQREAAAEVK